MKRIYSFIAAALTVMTAASCVQELVNDAHHQEGAVVYKAIAEGTDSKAVLGTNESGRPQSMWEDGDIIKIYPGGGMSYSFVTSLKEPSSVAEFKYSGYDNDDFSDVSVVLASFPASTARWADPQQENIMMQSEISTSQNVESDVDSYSRNAVPAVAYSADRTLHFQNAAALLKFQVNQDRVSRVRLTARHGEIITGMICIYLDAEHKISNILPDEYAYNAQETHKSYAELSSDGTFQSDRTYYLSIIPGTLESGFILEFFDANGTVIYTKDYDRSITIKRNVILDMGTLGEGSSEKLADYIDEYGINHGPGVEIDGVVWAPVNCGYHETDFKWGKLYQWGRKYGQGYDCPWDKTYIDASVPEKVQGYVDLVTGQSEANADKFYYGYMLIWHNIPYDNLWNLGTQNNPVKTEYDPCPEGWRVPTASELDALRNNSSSWTASDDQNGYWFSGLTSYASEVSQVFFPAAGYRRNDTSDGVDRNRGGYYWSSQDYGYCFYSSFSSTFNLSGLGASVRCVQDDSELISVSSLTLNTSSLMMHPGTGRDIYASIAPSNANHQSVYWSSSNTSVATVDMNGTVTAVSPGTATITAMAGMKTATCEVTVEYPDLDGTREVTLWRGESMVDNWNTDDSNYILSDGGTELLAAGAQPGDMVCFYVEPIEEYWEVQIFEGHWSHRYFTVRSGEYDLTANGGKILFPLTQEILDAAYMQQWWGGTFLLLGDNLKLTKITLLTYSPDTPSSSYDYVDEYGINHGPGVEIGGVIWAPVNCGYHATDFKWGKLYQWGRKYGQGYITPYYADKIGSIIEPGPVNILEGESMNNADVFFARLDYSDSEMSWRSLTWSKQSADNLWNVGTEENPVKTEYDPCPAGWRIPTYIEALSLESATSVWRDGWDDSYNGMAGNWISDPNNTSAKSFFPATGFFDEAGRGINRNYVGCYWCSPSSGQNSFLLHASSEEEFSAVNHPKVSGIGVRCVRDASELIPVADLTLSDSELSIVPGQTHSLSATIAPSSANHQYAYWYSDNPDVAIVSQDGKVRAVAQGTAVITAIAGMRSAECVVTVTSSPFIDTETKEQFVGTWIGTMYGMFQIAQYRDVKFTVTFDPEDGLIVSAGINPYFTMNGIDQAKYNASVEGNQLVVYAEQSVGYDDVLLLGFNHADANEATSYDHIRFVLNEDGTLTQPYAFGAYTSSGGGFYEIYNGGGTFAKEKNSIEDMPEIEL